MSRTPPGSGESRAWWPAKATLLVLLVVFSLSGCEGYLEGVAERNCNPTIDGYDGCVHDRATLQDRGLWPTPAIREIR